MTKEGSSGGMLGTAHLPLRGDRLAGKVALVSGAGSSGDLPGVGAATAILMAAQGAQVGVVDLDSARAEHTLAAIRQVGGEGVVLVGDISQAESCRRLAGETEQAFGGLQILVNNAAMVRRGDIRSLAPEDWNAMVGVNLTGAFQLSQACVPLLEQRGGSIINVSSIAGKRGMGVSPAYAACKAGLEGLTRDLATALGPAGIRVNTVVPGFLWAPMGANEQVREKRRQASALKTEGTAWDIAFASLFLASDESRWITADCITVDAGVTQLLPA